MIKVLLILSISLLSSFHIQSQNCIDIDYKLRASCYAGSSVKDSIAPGGFWQSPNIPKQLNMNVLEVSFPEKFQLYLDTENPITIEKEIKGFNLYLINRSGKTVALLAQDSRLYLKRQVYHNGKWQDVEYMPQSWCGNSYHTVFIQNDEYWEFEVFCMTGKVEASFRYELQLKDNQKIYSNVFVGSFNESQLKKEQNYSPTNIMDPYKN